MIYGILGWLFGVLLFASCTYGVHRALDDNPYFRETDNSYSEEE